MILTFFFSSGRRFSVYADEHHEPFFTYQIEEEIDSVASIRFGDAVHYVEHKELVALVDCSSIGGTRCGTHRIVNLNGKQMDNTVCHR